MNDIKLPPRRPLPPEVRARIRTRTLTRPEPRTWFPRSRAPLAVAAGVAALAAGAVIVGQSVTGGPGQPGNRFIPATGNPSAIGRPLDLKSATSELDRCWAAIQAEGKANRYPDRARWRAVTSAEYPFVKVTAAVADGQPLFCQTSVTTVRVSEPNPAPGFAAGSRTAALFISPEGIIAGIADQSWPGVGTWVVHGDASGGAQADLWPSGLFVAASWSRTDTATGLQVDRWVDSSDRAKHPERLDLPRPPAPVSRVDRPAPKADRESERGKWVQECLDKSDIPVPDPDMWQPGAWVTTDNGRLVVLRAGELYATCVHVGELVPESGELRFERWMFDLSGPAAGPGPDRPRVLGESWIMGRERNVIKGMLPDKITKLELQHGAGPVVQADIWNSTFAAVLPDQVGPTDVMRAYDASGNKLYEGSVN